MFFYMYMCMRRYTCMWPSEMGMTCADISVRGTGIESLHAKASYLNATCINKLPYRTSDKNISKQHSYFGSTNVFDACNFHVYRTTDVILVKLADQPVEKMNVAVPTMNVCDPTSLISVE